MDRASPHQVVLITSRDEGRENVTAVKWHTPISMTSYAISLPKNSHTLELITKSKVFAINFIPYKLQEEALFCGTHEGRFVDKFMQTGLSKAEAQNIDCPVLVDALGYIECELSQIVDYGDRVLVIGEVVNFSQIGRDQRLFQAGNDFTTTIR